MSAYSEKVLGQIVQIAERDQVNLFEASVQYCEEVDIEPEDLAEHLDKAALEQIRVAAVEGMHVRRSVHSISRNPLF